jgi:isochorismate hydrolase
MGTWWRRLISPDDPLSQLRLASPMSQVIEKTQYDAFHGTHLEAQLCQLGIRQVIIGGLMTHLCCETTARSAFVRGFEVIFLLDGTATYSREYHLATLLNLSQGFASLAACDEIINLISGDPRK